MSHANAPALANAVPTASRTTRRARGALFAGAALLLALGQAQAANFSHAVYAGAKDDLKTSYRAEREACDKLAGNAKDVCVEEAKGHEKIAEARLEYNYTGSAHDATRLYKTQYQVRYDIAREKCDDLAGHDKDVCVRAAKSERDKAKADLKLAQKVASATEDALDAHVKADYKLAREKCDALAGDAKDVCVASAKARYDVRW